VACNTAFLGPLFYALQKYVLGYESGSSILGWSKVGTDSPLLSWSARLSYRTVPYPRARAVGLLVSAGGRRSRPELRWSSRHWVSAPCTQRVTRMHPTPRCVRRRHSSSFTSHASCAYHCYRSERHRSQANGTNLRPGGGTTSPAINQAV
jgi:hypothetical protein